MKILQFANTAIIVSSPYDIIRYDESNNNSTKTWYEVVDSNQTSVVQVPNCLYAEVDTEPTYPSAMLQIRYESQS